MAADRLRVRVTIAKKRGSDGPEYYVLMWQNRYRFQAIRTLARWAGDEDLSFTWKDAAKCVRSIHKEDRQHAHAK